MKKLSVFSRGMWILLAMLMLVQPIYATQPDSTIEETSAEQLDPTETTEAVQESVEVESLLVQNGCRTIEAMVPLAGSGKMLDTAQAAFIYERSTDTVLYSYNPDVRLAPGTLAKMITALLIIENCNMDDTVTVSTRNYSKLPYNAINVKLKEGEELTVRDLVHGVVLMNANDAAVTLAEFMCGSQEEFVRQMNQWVMDIGCVNTYFTDCLGLRTSDQYTTARDMAKITLRAIRNATFRDVFAANSYTVPETNRSEQRSWKSMNYLREPTTIPQLNVESVTGGMVSYTSSIGASIVFTAEDDGMSILGVSLGSERIFQENGWKAKVYGNFEDAMKLIDFTFDGYKVCRLLHDGYALQQFPVANGENDVVGQLHTNMDALLPKDAKQDNLIFKYSVAGGGLVAPIQKDQEIASVEIWQGTTSCVSAAKLYAMSDVRAVDKSGLDIQGAARDDSNLNEILSFLGIVCLVVLVPLACYLAVNSIRRSIARNRRRRRRQSRRRSQ